MSTGHGDWRLPEVLLVLGLAVIAAAPIAWYLSSPPAAGEASAQDERAKLEAQVALLKRALEAQAPAAKSSAWAGLPPSRCAFEPLVPLAGQADGHAVPEHPFPGGPRVKAKVYARAAQKAKTEGRQRDAEVALIAACRQNELATRAPTVPLAQVLGRLGDQYVAAAARAEHPPSQERLLARARHVLALSAEVYTRALGPHASRSRMARQRVLDFDTGALATTDARSVERALTRTAPKIERERTGNAKPGTGSASIESEHAQVGKTVASRARAPSAEPVLSKQAAAELRQLASDLKRLRAQAETVSNDPAGLRSRAEAAHARRAQCGDVACLRTWHAQRRRELLEEF